jgi:hypothetical protein
MHKRKKIEIIQKEGRRKYSGTSLVWKWQKLAIIRATLSFSWALQP